MVTAKRAALRASPWVTVGGDMIDIATPYDPAVIERLKRLGARWMHGSRVWRLPVTLADRLEEALPEIHAGAMRALAGARRMQAPPPQSIDPPRLFQPDYLRARAGAPRHRLELASRGTGGGPDCWVAQIFATCAELNWVRYFVPGAYDWSGANKKGTRGVIRMFVVEEGPIYEVQEVAGRKGEPRRRYLRIWDGARDWMAEAAVRACLDN